MNIVFKLIMLAVVLVTMSSCGVRGALYLPDSPKPHAKHHKTQVQAKSKPEAPANTSENNSSKKE